MGNHTKLITPTQTIGDIFHDVLREDTAKLVSALAGIGPIILWGEWATLYYGVPVCEKHMHLLVPDDQLEDAYKALLASGFENSPYPQIPMVNELDPNIHWEDLGCPAYRVAGVFGQTPFLILIQNYSAAASTFNDAEPNSFQDCAGLAVPSLPLLAKSFLKTYFKLHSLQSRSRARGMIQVWCAYVKFMGYSPLGTDAMRDAPDIDSEMKLWWERGY